MKDLEQMRVKGIAESGRVRRLRFVFSCLIAAVWLVFLVSPITLIDFGSYPLTLAIVFLLVVIPFAIVILDLRKQYNFQLS